MWWIYPLSWYALCHDLVNFFSSIRNSLCDDDGSTNSSRSEANSTKTNMPFFVWPGTSSSSRFAANGLENWSPFYALRFIVCITWARPPTSNGVKSILRKNFIIGNKKWSMSFSSHFGNLVLGCFWQQSYLFTKILRDSLFTFFTEQGKTGKTEI